MKKVSILFLAVALLCLMSADASAVKNSNGKWALHDAGPHNAKGNTCAKIITDCQTQITVNGVAGPSRHDVYILALDVQGISGIRYGLCCDGGFFFYGWTKCSDYEIPSAGWPGCDLGNAQTWTIEKAGPHVTVGFMDIYAYGVGSLCMCVDPRVGYAEFCDGSEPSPICYKVYPGIPQYFGCVGFGKCGFNPCSIVPVEETSWGAVKAIYR